MSDHDDLVKRLADEGERLSGRSIDRGCVDSGIASILADEASATIEALQAENARLTARVAELEGERDEARATAQKWHKLVEAESGLQQEAIREFCRESVDLIDSTWMRRAKAAEAERDTANAKLARAAEALRRVKHINHGPDRASGEWRCIEAAAIASATLTDLEKADDKSN